MSYPWVPMLDETLYPYRSPTGIKQYNSTTPVTYGHLYRSLCDVVVPYTYFTQPYTKKPLQINEELLRYYVKETDE